MCFHDPRAVLAIALTIGTPCVPGSHDFMVMGDWGGLPIWPYRTPGEQGVAHALGKIAAEVSANYTLALGDNFYFTGVKTVDDARFRETFENVFTNDALKSPQHFRVLAGNHDHYGNCSAEIAYTRISPRWHFPNYYYDFEETGTNGVRVHHVMIDTVLLAGQSSHPTSGVELPGSEYPGPDDTSVAEAQWEWINKTLSTSTADYLIVAGHFPVWSICEHGPTMQLVTRLKPMLEASRVSVYLAGHDHCAQHLDEGRGVQYHGVGAGIQIDPSTKHKNAIPQDSLKWHLDAGFFGHLEGAFAHVSIGDQGLVVSHYSSSKGKVYQASPVLPRTHRHTGETAVHV